MSNADPARQIWRGNRNRSGLSTAMSENRQTNAVAHPIFSL